MRAKLSSMKSIVILMLVFNSQILLSQNSSISGMITDSTYDAPLIGANVFLQGISLGAATDKDGKYSIKNIPNGDYVLKVSYIGYMTKSIIARNFEPIIIIILHKSY